MIPTAGDVDRETLAAAQVQERATLVIAVVLANFAAVSPNTLALPWSPGHGGFVVEESA